MPSANLTCRSTSAPRLLVPLILLMPAGCQQGQLALPTIPLPSSIPKPDGPIGGSLIPPPRIHVATADDRARQETLAPPHAKVATRVASEPNLFLVEVPDVDRIAVKQKTVTTCWAACTQTLLAADHRRVDQTELADKFRPGREDQSANLWVVIEALCPEHFPQLDKQATAFVNFMPVTSDNLIRALMARKLTIVGLTGDQDGDGHACVVYGATFARASTAGLFESLYPPQKNDLVKQPGLAQQALWEYALVEVTVFDPFFDQGGKRTLSAEEFARKAQFLVNRPIAEQMVTRALAARNDPSVQQKVRQVMHPAAAGRNVGAPRQQAPTPAPKSPHVAGQRKPQKETPSWRKRNGSKGSSSSQRPH